MQSEFVNALFAWVTAHPGWMSFFIFVSAAAESLTIVGVIIPGALVMFTLGAFIGLGHVDFWSAYWWSTLGAIVGDAISFWIGRVFQQGIRRVWPFTKHPELITRSEEFFRKHGGKGVLFGRFFGPVRGTIPTVAGMMDMTWRNFMIANVISGILWAPVYLLPGMAFGASLDIASRVAGRLVVLILIVVALLWVTTWLVKYLVRLFQSHAADWVPRFHAWSQGRRFIGPISASLLDPAKGELRGLTVLAAVLLGGIVLFSLSLSAAGQRLPSGLDLSFYHFFQALRTPWADALMVFTAGLGDYQVTLPVSLVVFGWLIWQRNRSAAWHWLAALGFGMITNLLFKGLLPVSNPAEVSEGLVGYSFPSSHATFSTLVFGFLAVLIAREIPPARRWIVYHLAAVFMIVPIAFARLYLGIHWLTDTLAGLCLGLIWVAVLGLAYNHHTTVAVNWRRLLATSLIALLATDLLHVSVNFGADLQRYQPQATELILSRAGWWEQDWRRLPQQRRDFGGQRRQDFVLQWAASRKELERRLREAGWQPAPGADLKSMLLWLSPQVQLRELPVLPQTHEGSEDDLTLVRYSDDSNKRWLLRFWDVGARLGQGGPPIWVGSVSQQKLEPQMRLFTFAVDDPLSRAPVDLLAPAWHGLRTRVVKGVNPNERITLIAD
ncbi:MAG: VTT domain-containing protein [Candidatus Contendobacter sp.]|nr:VTT domain-containing protein [Candidatus Contendobacter sp.]